MKNKRLLLLTLALACTPCLFAQKADARNIMEKMSQLYRQWKGMSVTFAANIRSETGGASESFEGVIVMKGDKFVLTTAEMITWFDGATQWTYVTRNEEVNIITPSRSDLQFLNPMILIRDYEKDFKIEYIGESTSTHAKAAYDIALVPKKQEDIIKIEIQIEKTNSLPARIVIIMRNNMRNTITIDKIEQKEIADVYFSFPSEQYPNAEIIDLR